MFGINPTATSPQIPTGAVSPTAVELRKAADAFLAAGKATPAWKTIVREQLVNNELAAADMAAKVAKFGSYASPKQQAYAKSLVERAKALQVSTPQPVAPSAPAAGVVPSSGIPVADLFRVMQKHASFYVGKLTLNRQNQDSRVWIKHADAEKAVGKIENGVAILWKRPGVDQDTVMAILGELEANPLLAAKKYGRLSGRCCSCGRDLTDQDSIDAGIGPVCANKFE